jgi:hypothetical protein
MNRRREGVCESESEREIEREEGRKRWWIADTIRNNQKPSIPI